MEIALEEEEQSSPKLDGFIRVILTRLVSSSLPMDYPFKQRILKNDWRIVNLQRSTNFRCTAKCFSYPYQSVQLFSSVRLFATPWTAGRQASLSITNSRSLLKFMSIESVKPSNHLIHCRPLLLPPSIFASIRVFLSVLHIRWPKDWSFSFNISPSNEYSGLISFRMDWLISLLSNGFSRVLSNGFSSVFSNTTVQKHQFFSAQLSSQSNSHIHT